MPQNKSPPTRADIRLNPMTISLSGKKLVSEKLAIWAHIHTLLTVVKAQYALDVMKRSRT